MKRFVINHTEVVEETKESYIKYSCQDMIRDEINRDIKEYELEGEAMIEDDIRTEGTIEPTIH
jgi:anaerobic ribonucleoside-triphosphate reductase